MFIGRFYHTLETNGRVSLPKAFREAQTNWIVTRGLDGGLFAFPADDFSTQLQELAERSFTVKDNRDFIRLMANDAAAVEVDKQGRVQLPEYLIELAGLTKQVVVVGSYRYLELWDRDSYHRYWESLGSQAEQIAERLET